MNILNAINAMARGDAVRRAGWSDAIAWIAFAKPFRNVGTTADAWVLVAWESGALNTCVQLDPVDLIADDWTIVV